MTSNHTQSKADVMFFVHTIGKEPGQIIREYITVRYERWLDYSKYKCSSQNMGELAVDLLNEVLLNVLQLDEQFLLNLYKKKKIQKGVGYTELDFYILRAISLNSTSDTAPFRYKTKPIPVDREVKLERLKIIDEEYLEIDRPAQLLKQTKLVRWVFNGLNLTVFEHYVFEQKFFHEESYDKIECGANYKLKNSLYQDTLTVIHNVLYYYNLTKYKPLKELTGRQNELCTEFIKTHRIQTFKSK